MTHKTYNNALILTVVEKVCIHMKHHFDRTDFETKGEHIYSWSATVFSQRF